MATTYVNFGLGVAVGVQGSGLGTVNSTIAGLTGSLGLSDGLVLGDPSGGVGETGISISLERSERDAVDVTGSFTRQAGTFLSEGGTITIVCALRGAGNTATATPVDADMALSTTYPGLNALLRAAGWNGSAWGSGVGHQYVPAAAAPVTVKLWEGEAAATTGNAWVAMDCFASLSIDFTPGDVPIATFTIPIGSVYSFTAALTVPTFTYGTVASVSSPVVKNVGNVWGPADARGFSSLTVSIDSEIEETPDSNSTNGTTSRQTGRSITISGELYSEDSDTDFERAKLVGTTAPTEDMTFTVGTAADGTATNPCLGFIAAFNNIVVTSLEPAKIGPYQGHAVEGYCTATSANAEGSLTFI